MANARYVRDFTVWMRFKDGLEGELDLGPWLRDFNPVGVFAPLLDVEYFAKVRFDPDLRTIGWPNGADWAPDSLYQMLLGQELARDRD